MSNILQIKRFKPMTFTAFSFTHYCYSFSCASSINDHLFFSLIFKFKATALKKKKVGEEVFPKPTHSIPEGDQPTNSNTKMSNGVESSNEMMEIFHSWSDLMKKVRNQICIE